MERFFLIFSIIRLWGCQLPSMIPADKYIEPQPVETQETPIIYENVWQRIDDKSSFKNSTLDEKTLKYINSYLSNLEQFNLLIEKGEFFIFFTLEELEKYNLPPELALLPYIESNYDPFSISTSGAMGIWQFMPSTARIYGLKDTWWYEQRHDPFVSTKAAVRYLAYLHNRFNNNINYCCVSYKLDKPKHYYWSCCFIFKCFYFDFLL